MSKLRTRKVLGMRDSIPTPALLGDEQGEMLVLGWGSTYGAITSAVEELHKDGVRVFSLHLRHFRPLSKGLDASFSQLRSLHVAEMNPCQLARILRSEYPQHDFLDYSKVQRQLFRTSELVRKIRAILEPSPGHGRRASRRSTSSRTTTCACSRAAGTTRCSTACRA